MSWVATLRFLEDFASPQDRRVDSSLNWLTSPLGWITINIDGVVCLAGLEAACGGVIRYHNGKFLVGFSVGLGSVSVVAVELWGIFYGIQTTLKKGFLYIVVESNSEEVVNLIENFGLITHPNVSLVEEIHKMSKLPSRFVVKHVLWEQNKVVDVMTKGALGAVSLLVLFESPPMFVASSIVLDVVGSLAITSTFLVLGDVEKGFWWKLGDGMSNDVWKKPWLRSTTNAYIQTPLYPGMENLKVNDLKDNHLGIWNVPLIDHLFDRGDLQAITNVPILDVSRGEHIWAHISYGVYTSSSNKLRSFVFSIEFGQTQALSYVALESLAEEK
ncbi:hypothetical protein JHK87_047563 [Glycine soja]|nr:hypothetical protein JHK87_047563 [Glycine soja]